MSIQFVNNSTVVTPEAFAAFISAVNKQLSSEFASYWGKPYFTALFTILDEPGENDPQGDRKSVV